VESSAEPELFLEGVIVAADPHRSVALVRRPGGGYARAVSVGETIYGFELLEVTDSGILVRGEQQVLRLGLSGEWQPAPATAPPDPVSEPRVQEPASVRKELERNSVEARLSEEMPRILTQTGLTPRVLEGRVKGFRITRLPGGTVLDDAGIRTGDVLLSINEISLNSPYTLIDLYPRLQSEEEIRVVLERGGKTLTYVYDFD
jgi:general secretion pathway protein C